MTDYLVDENKVFAALKSAAPSIPPEERGHRGHTMPDLHEHEKDRGHDRGHDPTGNVDTHATYVDTAKWRRVLDDLTNRAHDDLEAVLDATEEWFRTYLYTTNIERDASLLALWVAHTYVVTETYTTPRLQFSSPEYGSGKSTALDHMKRLTCEGERLTGNMSSAFLPRYLEDGPRTVLLDEVEKTLKPSKDSYNDIIAVLNDGYRFGAKVPVLVPGGGDGKKWTPASMQIFAPVCWAGNSPEIPDDAMSRTIRVTMLPDMADAVSETDWRDLEDLATELHDHIERRMEAVRDQVRTSRPTVPEGCRTRLREVWGPLKVIAELASPRWAERVDRMIVDALEAQEQDREAGLQKQTPARRLMVDIREAFRSQDPADGFFATEDLIEHLVRLNPRWWDEHGEHPRLSPQRLGYMLRDAYGIHPRKRSSKDAFGKRPKGYYRESLAAAFESLGACAKDECE